MMKYLLLLFFALTLSACFRTRIPEPPDTSGSGFVLASDYQTLLSNFKTAIQAGNTQNYKRCLNETVFHFSPAPAQINGHESIWQNWSMNDEENYFNTLKGRLNGGMLLSFSNESTQGSVNDQDSLRYVADYTLNVPHDKPNVPTTFKGQIQLLIKLNGNECKIEEWTDVETHQDSSWSALKLNFVQ
jgi:hypothetical protein